MGGARIKCKSHKDALRWDSIREPEEQEEELREELEQSVCSRRSQKAERG